MLDHFGSHIRSMPRSVLIAESVRVLSANRPHVSPVSSGTLFGDGGHPRPAGWPADAFVASSLDPIGQAMSQPTSTTVLLAKFHLSLGHPLLSQMHRSSMILALVRSLRSIGSSSDQYPSGAAGSPL